MAQFEGLARQAKNDGMLARRIAASRRAWIVISAAVPGIPRPCRRGPSRLGSAPLAGELGQPKGRPAGRVFLGSVMPFDDGDVGGRAQCAGGLADQFHEQIDRAAHVGGDQDRDLRSRRYPGLAALGRR